jgi:hypothetical protein
MRSQVGNSNRNGNIGEMGTKGNGIRGDGIRAQYNPQTPGGLQRKRCWP